MSGSEQVMAVMLEEDDLRMVHRDWPSKMRLAVCLMPSGDCQLLLFRQEEAGIFAQRLRKHLGLRPEEICLYPPVHGFPSRQLRYSDERSLAALLADSPQLVEDATDYSVNFAFALEEGLDPVEFLGVEETVAFEPMIAPEPVVQDGGTLQFSSRRAPVVKPIKPAVRKLTFDLAREAARISEGEASAETIKPEPVHDRSIFPGEAFKPISELAAAEPTGYQLTEEDGYFVISNGTGPTVEIDNAAGLFLRDDRRLLAIRIENMGHPPPNTLRLQSAILPKSLKATLRAACGTVDLKIDGNFAYVDLPTDVTPEPATPVAAAPEARPSDKSNSLWKSTKRRRFVRVLTLTTLTIVAIFAVLGLQPVDVLNQNAEIGPIDWSQFRLSMDGSP